MHVTCKRFRCFLPAFAVFFVLSIFTLLLTSQVVHATSAQPDISCDFAVLIDADSGTVLFDKDATLRAFPASTTKIMTAILVIENCKDFDEIVTVESEVRDFVPENSLMGLKEKEKIRVIDLLYGMMLVSGNDAAATLAIHFGGSKEGFAEMMNAKAKEIGLSNTHFVNPHGLNNEEHYTTALEMAKIAQYAMKNETFRKLVSTPDYMLPKTNKHSEKRQIFNTNKFLTSKESEQKNHWKYVTGIKTGSTSAAQGCLVTSATKDGVNLICVVFHDTSDRYVKRWEDSRKLLEYGFENLLKIKLSEVNINPQFSTVVKDASRNDSSEGQLQLNIKSSDITISGLKDDIEKIKTNPSLLEVIPRINNGNQLVAPVAQDQIVGTAAIKFNDTTLAIVDLVASRSVASSADDTTHNTVNNLIEGVVEAPSIFTPTTIAIICVVAFILIFAIALFFRKRRLSRFARSNRRRKSGYYDYYKR